MLMPRNPLEADWLIRSSEEEAARATRWATVAQQQVAYQTAMAKAHAADAAGLRALWTFIPLSAPGLAEPSGSQEQTAVEVPPPEPTEPPKCGFCGKPTRIWRGKPQKFCSFPKTASGYSCSHRWRDRHATEIRQKIRAESKAVERPEITCAEIVQKSAEEPKCLYCSKPTRIWRGKAQKFCSPPAGRKISSCTSAFHSQARHARSTRRVSQRARRTKKQSAPARPSGSVLATASPQAPGHALLASVTQAVPQHLPDDLRSEIVSETIVLVLEGVELSQAVIQATKSVRKNGALLRYTKPIDDCVWLAAETPD